MNRCYTSCFYFCLLQIPIVYLKGLDTINSFAIRSRDCINSLLRYNSSICTLLSVKQVSSRIRYCYYICRIVLYNIFCKQRNFKFYYLSVHFQACPILKMRACRWNPCPSPSSALQSLTPPLYILRQTVN